MDKGNEGGPFKPPFCCHLAFATTPAMPCGALRRQSRPRLPRNAVQHRGPSSQATPAFPFLAMPYKPVLAMPAMPYPSRPRRALPVLRSQSRTTEPCLPRVTKPIGAHRSTPRLHRAAKRCLSGHACHAMSFLERAWPRHTVPAEPSRTMPVHATPAIPILAHPSLPHLPRLTWQRHASPAMQVQSWPRSYTPSLPRLFMALRALPCLHRRTLHYPDHA